LAENSLRGLIGKPQVQPWGGSEHIGQTLEQAGLVSDVRRPKTELLASLISPASAAKTVLNAPKTAMTALRWMDNLDSAPTMARMGQRGAIHNIFHGTTPDAAKAIERDGFDLSKSADGSIWFTSNPNIGEVAASGSGGIVRRTLDDEKLKLGGWDEADKYGVDELLSQGYDGLMLDDGGDVVYQVFNPSKLGQPVTAPQPGLLGKMVAPQDEALRVAQANAAKPVSEGGLGLRPDNTPEERAAAMGFDTPAFHATGGNIEAFDMGMVGDLKSQSLGIHATNSAEEASGYAKSPMREGAQRNILPLLLNMDGASYYDTFKTYPNRFIDSRGQRDMLIAEKTYGDNVGLKNYLLQDPSRIRSRFAAFDPMRRDSPDLLAGFAPLGLVPWLPEQDR
jgi:hypothetical protein